MHHAGVACYAIWVGPMFTKVFEHGMHRLYASLISINIFVCLICKVL